MKEGLYCLRRKDVDSITSMHDMGSYYVFPKNLALNLGLKKHSAEVLFFVILIDFLRMYAGKKYKTNGTYVEEDSNGNVFFVIPMSFWANEFAMTKRGVIKLFDRLVSLKLINVERIAGKNNRLQFTNKSASALGLSVKMKGVKKKVRKVPDRSNPIIDEKQTLVNNPGDEPKVRKINKQSPKLSVEKTGKGNEVKLSEDYYEKDESPSYKNENELALEFEKEALKLDPNYGKLSGESWLFKDKSVIKALWEADPSLNNKELMRECIQYILHDKKFNTPDKRHLFFALCASMREDTINNAKSGNWRTKGGNTKPNERIRKSFKNIT